MFGFKFFKRKKDKQPTDEEIRARIAAKVVNIGDSHEIAKFKATKGTASIVPSDTVAPEPYDPWRTNLSGRDSSINKKRG